MRFPKGSCPKVNATDWLEFELAYYVVAVLHVSHYATETSCNIVWKEMLDFWRRKKMKTFKQSKN